MAYGITRVPVFDLKADSDLWQLWKNHNDMVGRLDGHTHNATAGGANSSGLALGAGAAKLTNLEGRDLATGATVTAAGGSTGANRARRPTDGASSLLAAIAKETNALIQQLENHAHGGITAGGAATTGLGLVSGPFAPQKIAGPDGKAPDGSTPVAGSTVTVRQVRLTGRYESDLGEVVVVQNALLTALDNHVHNGVTAGGAASSAFAFPGGQVNKIADVGGRGPDGAVVS